MKDAEEYIQLSKSTPSDFEFDRFVRVWVESRKPEIAEELLSRYQHLAGDIYAHIEAESRRRQHEDGPDIPF
jgi:hypothetical protein